MSRRHPTAESLVAKGGGEATFKPTLWGYCAHGALKACGLLGREATTSFISLQL